MQRNSICNFGTHLALGAILLATIFLSPASAAGQNLTGEINGIVQDSAGAVIPSAVVIVTNTAQNTVVRTLQTSRDGEFNATQLLPGNYSVTVKKSGFETSIRLVDVHVDQTASLHIPLVVGSTSTSVTVTASTIAPETQNVAAQTLFEGSEVRELPMSGRNYQELFLLQPGVTGAIPGTIYRGVVAYTGGVNSATFSTNGQEFVQNAYYLDGADIENHGGNGQSVVFPSVDSLQEMNFLRNSYGAQYAGIGGGVVLMQTRSGSTGFHGSAYGFFQTTDLTANNYFSNLASIPRPVTRYNDFGYTIGGPIWIPHHQRQNAKTFFFVAQEFLRSALSTQTTITGMPTAQQRQGMFTAPVCVAWTTSAQSTCSSSTTSITNFDATAQGYLTDIINKMPLPNSTSDPQGYIFAPASVVNENQIIVRLDQQIGHKLSVLFRYFKDPFFLQLPHAYGQGQMAPFAGDSKVSDNGRNFVFHATYTPTSATVIDGGYARNYYHILTIPIGLMMSQNSPDIHPTLPFVSTLGRVPSLNVGINYTIEGPLHFYYDTNQTFINLTHTAGRHTFYYGAQYETTAAKQNTGSTNAGAYTVTSSAKPTGSAATAYMQEFAQFLIGDATSFTQSSVDEDFGAAFNQFEAYFQDDIRLTPRLTVNVGMRYTYDTPEYSVPFNGVNTPVSTFVPANYNPAQAPTLTTSPINTAGGGGLCLTAPCAGGVTPNPNYNPLNGLIIGNRNSPYGAAADNSPITNFAPRFGTAFDVTGDGKTSLRDGFGVFFITNAQGGIPLSQSTNPPNVTNVSLSNFIMDNPAAGAAAAPTPPVIDGAQANEPQPYIIMYNLDVQRVLWRGSLLDVGYYGNVGRHIVGFADLNQPKPGAYVTAGLATAGKITAANTPVLNEVRPFTGYDTMNIYYPEFISNYNSLQTSFKQRLNRQSMVNVSYTYGKALTTNQANTGSQGQNIYDIAAEYGPTAYDRTHVLNAEVIYDLPTFSHWRALPANILGGWEVSGTVQTASGLYMTALTTAVDPAGVGLLDANASGIQNRPDRIGDPNSGAPHTRTNWYNVSAFTNVPSGQIRTGNEQPGSIIGPGYVVANLGLFKNFALPEKMAFQLRAEAFNVPNHTNFQAVAVTTTASNAGQVTTAGSPRTLQLAAKFTF